MDREADPDPTRPKAGCRGGLEPPQRRAGHDVAVELRERAGERLIHGANRGLVRREVEEPDRLTTEPEAQVGRRELAIERDRLAIEVREDRIEGMLDDARIRA